MKRFIYTSLLLNFLVLMVTGGLRFFTPFHIHLSRLHIFSGLMLALLILVHLVDRYQPLKTILMPRRKPVRARVWLAPLIALCLCFALWASAWFGIQGIAQLMAFSHEQRNHASIFRTQENVAYHHQDRLTRITKLTTTDASLNLELLWKSSPHGCAVAIWAETKAGSIIETLYLTGSLKYSESHPWEQGTARRGKILPVWRHRYTAVCGVDPYGAPDLISQPTLNHQWLLDNHLNDGEDAFVVFAEVNLPNDDAPSLIYAAHIDPESQNPYTLLSLVGHSGGSEKDGELNYNLASLPANIQIVERILVKTTFGK
ncbi:MAG: hypothetical protein KJO21_11470 [Verrucomicrobiae bacterium]|nr:hypothetical protein [Verrucomicrobiae bacterium]NNJ42906.1 hypothetical protein [Akkermansiaceae bacterium]